MQSIAAVSISKPSHRKIETQSSVQADHPAGVGASGDKERPGFKWSFLGHLGSILLNRLQLKINKVHLEFQVRYLTATFDAVSEAVLFICFTMNATSEEDFHCNSLTCVITIALCCIKSHQLLPL